MILSNIAIAGAMIIITTVLHAGGMIVVMHGLQKQSERWRKKAVISHIYWVGGTIFLMFIVSVLEVLVWALTYMGLGAIQNIEQALYFSMVTFTTLGYGDVLLDERWRLLGSFEAANGIIMFGWTTAIVIAVVQRVYYSEQSGTDHSVASDKK